MAGKNMPPSPAPAPDPGIQKVRESAEYQAMKKKILKKFGNTVLNVVQAEISKEDVKTQARAIAVDTTDTWEDNNRKKRQAKEDLRVEKKALKKYDQDSLDKMTAEEKQEIVDKYKQAHNTKINKLAQIVRNIPFGISDSVRRSVMLSNTRKQAEKAMLETGRLEAGKAAAERYRELKETKAITDKDGKVIIEKATEKDIRENAQKTAKEKIDELNEDEKYDENNFVGRVASKAAEEKGDFFKDRKVTLKDKNSEEYNSEKAQLKEMYAAYMLEVVKSSSGTNKGNLAVAKAREAFEKKLKEADFNQDKAHYDNHRELLDKIDDEYRGSFASELTGKKASPKRHQAALDAIDEYLEDRLNLMSGQVKTGLDMKVSTERAADKATLRYGVVLGTLASGLVGGAKAISRSKVLKCLDTASGALGVKMILGAAFGGVAGAIKKKQGQRYEEMRQAIGAEKQNDDDKSHYEKVSVGDAVKEIHDLREELNNGNNIAENRAKLLEKLGDLRARTELEEKNKIALLSYDSRDSIEKQRYELVQEARKAREALELDEKHEVLVTDLVAATDKARKDILAKKEVVDKEKHKERVASAKRGALIGAAAAFFATMAADRIFHGGKIMTEQKEFWGSVFNSSNGAGAAELAEAGAAMGAAGVVADKMDDTGGINISKNEDLPYFEVDNKAEMIDYKSGAAVLIEDDPQGGVAIGFDNNGNGTIDAEEYLVGGGEEPGVNLVNRESFEEIRDNLKENYNLDLQREVIDSTKYDQIAVNNYLDNADNAVSVKGSIIDADSYNVSLGVPEADYDVDGMTQYVVNVDGDYPDGTKLFIDFDGNGNGKVLEFPIENGKVVVPADVVDTNITGNSGVGNFFGRATVGRMDGDKIVSYAEMSGTPLGATDSLTASVTESGYAFTVTDAQGESVSTFAVNTQGKMIGNTSAIFNGISVGESDRLPAGFSRLEGIEDHGTLASGEKVPDVGDYHGGYNAQYDSSINHPFKSNGNPSLVGIPETWDANGDGVMDAVEETSYFKQQLVRTATNPFVLGQNASNYGLLEPDTLAKNLFNGDADAMTETLKSWGVSGGVVDSEKDLQHLLDHLKMPENSEYYDKLVNSTITEMQEQIAGGGFEQGTLADRISTYINKDGVIDTKGNASIRAVLFPYKTGPNGEKIYVGNKGWWVRKYYGAEGGKVGDLPLCEQKAIVTGKSTEEKTIEEKTTTEKTTEEKVTDEKTTEEKATEEKSTDEKTTEEKSTDEKTTEEKTTEEKSTDEKTTEEKATDEKTTEEKSTDEKTTEEKTTEEKTTEEKSTDEKTTEEKSTEEKTTEEKTTEEKTTEEKSTDEKTTEEKTTEEKSTDEKTTEEKTTEEKTIEEKTTEEKTTEEKSTDEKTTEEKTTEEKTTEEKTTEEKTTEELSGKTGNMNAGDNVRPMGVTEIDPEAEYVEATPDNHVDPAVHPGDQVNDANADIYKDDAVLDENGEIMTDQDGNMYVTNPDNSETQEEIMQNIQDDTQTTFTEDTTKYDENADSSLASEYWTEQNAAAGENPDAVDMLNTTERPLATGLGSNEEIPDLADSRSGVVDNQVLTEDEQNKMFSMFGKQASSADNADSVAAAADDAITVSSTTEDVPVAPAIEDIPVPPTSEDIVAEAVPAIETTPTTPVSEDIVFQEAPTEQPTSVDYGTAFTPTETADYSDPNSFRPNQLFTDEEEESMFNMFK